MMPRTQPMRGLIAATFTPIDSSGNIDLQRIGPMIDRLIEQRIAGFYILGSTGEGLSLTAAERIETAKCFIDAVGGRAPVIVQVGCESLWQAKELASAAQAAGADAISAVTPVYFKPDSIKTLVDSMAVIASGAPRLPFYYYHIPAITGVNHSPLEFLKLGATKIANLRGLKFTSPSIHDYQACVEFDPERFEIMWGVDEMLLSGLVAGGQAAVGSTYNFCPAVYHRLIAAFEQGDLQSARCHQAIAQSIVRTFVPFGPRAAQKAMMAMVGLDCGEPRLPITPMSTASVAQLRDELEAIGFFDAIQDR